jgi:hypothetical protein
MAGPVYSKYDPNLNNYFFGWHSKAINGRAFTFSVSSPKGGYENSVPPGEVVNHLSLRWVSGLCVSTVLQPAAVLLLPQMHQQAVTNTNTKCWYCNSLKPP